MNYRALKYQLSPFADVLIFIITLLIANYAWKWTVIGDEDGEIVSWLGMDITALFRYMASHIASAVYWLISLFRDTAYMTDPFTIRFTSGSGTRIIWGCTPIKQCFIFLCLILTVRALPSSQPAYRLWLHKLWYIPLGWICCYAFNILRIFFISLFIEFHPEWFTILHDYIFKYIFYAMLFGLWLIFAEKIRPSA